MVKKFFQDKEKDKTTTNSYNVFRGSALVLENMGEKNLPADVPLVPPGIAKDATENDLKNFWEAK